MNMFNLFRRGSAPIARERLQILLAHERNARSQPDLLGILREEILAVISRHVSFDPDKVIVDAAKPLLEGALGPGAGSSRVASRVQEASKSLRVKLKTPWEKLPVAARETLLKHVLETLAEIYSDAPADYQEWLTEYMSPVPCPACGGKRLRPSSLAVRVKNISIAEFTAMPLSRA